jgi:cytochrome c
MTGRWAWPGVSLAFASMITVALAGAAWGQREPPDLKALAPGQQVSSVRYCRGLYEVALKDGSVRSFKEFDLGFKTDTSAKGPEAATPALVPTGRVGDRAFVVFAGLDELKAWIKKC